MEQTEISTMAKEKPPVNNVFPSYNETESMVAAQVYCTTEQLVAKEVPTLAADSLEDILQCRYEKACTGVCRS